MSSVEDIASPLGTESGEISDSQITVSSENTEINGEKKNGRLNAPVNSAWCAKAEDTVRTLTVTLTQPHFITKVS